MQFSQIKRFNTIKISILLFYRLNVTPIKSSTELLILKYIWKCKRPRIAKILLKKNKRGGFKLLDTKTYYKAKLPYTSVILT